MRISEILLKIQILLPPGIRRGPNKEYLINQPLENVALTDATCNKEPPPAVHSKCCYSCFI